MLILSLFICFCTRRERPNSAKNIFNVEINTFLILWCDYVMDGLFVTLTIGDITVKKTGSEALQSEGKSSKSKTFRSSKLTLHLSEHLFTNACFDVESFEVMIPPQNDKPGLKKGFPWKEHENSTFAWVAYFPFFHSLTKFVVRNSIFTLSQALLSKSPSIQRNMERRTKYLRKSKRREVIKTNSKN